MRLDLESLQSEVKEWAQHNFPDHKAWECLLGLQEELGELSHAWLKRHQNIRTAEGHDAKIRDAVGDIVIFLTNFCVDEGISLKDCIIETWEQVRQRDWRKPSS